jgi:hypothetical protein
MLTGSAPENDMRKRKRPILDIDRPLHKYLLHELLDGRAINAEKIKREIAAKLRLLNKQKLLVRSPKKGPSPGWKATPKLIQYGLLLFWWR